jgi:DNA invertase Pin-like site-specific DNA recombinase
MTTDLFALRARARSIATISILTLGAVLITAPTPRKLVRRRRRGGNARTALHTEAVRATPPAPTPAPEPAPVPQPAATASRMSTGLEPGSPVIGYVTAGDEANGRLTPPERAIERACERAGWRLVAIVRDREGGRLLDRPGLSHALDRIADGQAGGLVVTDARLLARSMDFAGLVSWFQESDAALIALDLGVDTSTPEGSRVASTLVTINGWAGGRIAARAAAARQQLLARIATMHDEEDMSLQAIADQLNAEGVRTLSGADAWWPSGVQTALRYWRSTQPPVAELPLEERATG